jgi:hypothetical protein
MSTDDIEKGNNNRAGGFGVTKISHYGWDWYEWDTTTKEGKITHHHDLIPFFFVHWKDINKKKYNPSWQPFYCVWNCIHLWRFIKTIQKAYNISQEGVKNVESLIRFFKTYNKYNQQLGAKKKETAKRVVGKQVKCLPTTLLNDSINEVHDSDNNDNNELDCIKNALNVYLGEEYFTQMEEVTEACGANIGSLVII